jgi:hypothetical protein
MSANKDFCDLASTLFGRGWVRIAAAVQVADLRHLRAMQGSLDVEPTREDWRRLLGAAYQKRADLNACIERAETIFHAAV